MLVVDDAPDSAGLLHEVFEREGYEVVVAASGAEAVRLAQECRFDVVLSNVRLPDIDGIEVLRRLKKADPDLAVILLTAFGTVETAIKAMHEGAFDYVRKPFELDVLRRCVERALQRRQLVDERRVRAEDAAEPTRVENIVGSSPGMVELFKLVSRVAGTKSSVLIRGESGAGKELIARTIHLNSPRRGHPFVAVNCMSFSEGVLESELFGHVRGAFTGATERRPGLFLEADHGTLFLDEIGDMSLSMQAKLLRVLQEQEVKPVGGTEMVPIDVRVVAATHRDLDALVRAGRFREDLYYRLNVVTLNFPPLRERLEDVPRIATHYLTVFSEQANRPIHGFTPEAMAALRAYAWPGNVRELVNVVERAVALAPGSVVEITDLPEKLATRALIARAIAGQPTDRPTLAEVTRRYVLQVLGEVGGNKTEAARLLGVPRRTLYRMLARLESGEASDNVGHYGPLD